MYFKMLVMLKIIPDDQRKYFGADYHQWEVLPSHFEVVLLTNSKKRSFTGTSCSLAWHIGKLHLHQLVMWSLPYNLHLYRAYFAIGVIKLFKR